MAPRLEDLKQWSLLAALVDRFGDNADYSLLLSETKAGLAQLDEVRKNEGVEGVGSLFHVGGSPRDNLRRLSPT